MRGLKALVITMGVLVMAGLAVVVITIAKRAGDTPADGPRGGFDARHLAIPAGATVVASHGAGGRLIVRLALADGTARLLIIDPATGRLLGRLDLAPE